MEETDIQADPLDIAVDDIAVAELRCFICSLDNGIIICKSKTGS